MEEDKYTGKFIRITEQVLRAGTETITYERAYFHDSVKVIPLIKEKTVRLIQEIRPEKNHETHTIFPGGLIENGESALECAHRELREELQMDANDLEQLAEFRHIGPINTTATFFIARNLTPIQSEKDATEVIVGYEDFDIETLYTKTMNSEFKFSSESIAAVAMLYNKLK